MLRKCEVEVHRQARYLAWRGTAPGQAAPIGPYTRTRASCKLGELLYARNASWAAGLAYTRAMRAGKS